MQLATLTAKPLTGSTGPRLLAITRAGALPAPLPLLLLLAAAAAAGGENAVPTSSCVVAPPTQGSSQLAYSVRGRPRPSAPAGNATVGPKSSGSGVRVGVCVGVAVAELLVVSEYTDDGEREGATDALKTAVSDGVPHCDCDRDDVADVDALLHVDCDADGEEVTDGVPHCDCDRDDEADVDALLYRDRDADGEAVKDALLRKDRDAPNDAVSDALEDGDRVPCNESVIVYENPVTVASPDADTDDE